MKIELKPKLYKQEKFYGTTSLGARGQVVIPIEARKALKLKQGEKLLVMGKIGKVLVLIKAKELNEIVSFMVNNVASGKKSKQFFLTQARKILKQIK
jgi:AbrB family looped-hinge helix DNA binding protein